MVRRDVLDVLDLTSAREATRQVFLTFKNMQAVLRWAVAQQYLTSNPMEGMEKPLGSTPNERVLTMKKFANFGSVCRRRCR